MIIGAGGLLLGRALLHPLSEAAYVIWILSFVFTVTALTIVHRQHQRTYTQLNDSLSLADKGLLLVVVALAASSGGIAALLLVTTL